MTTSATNAPACVGVIMDGNRRFARERGLPLLEGHRQGYEKLKEVVDWCKEAGVKSLIVYALSIENWNRAPEEVAYLLDLFRIVIRDEVAKLHKEKVAVRFIGDLSRFPADLQEMMRETERHNPKDAEHTLGIASSYGGRSEVLHAANVLREHGEEATEESFSRALFTHGIPDPDIIIRTGGEMRLSGFLPWQSVYSELFFVPTYWPAFSKKEFTDILEQYASRERRFGK